MTNANDGELDKILDLAGFQIFPYSANENRLKAKAAFQSLLERRVLEAIAGTADDALFAASLMSDGPNAYRVMSEHLEHVKKAALSQLGGTEKTE